MSWRSFNEPQNIIVLKRLNNPNKSKKSMNEFKNLNGSKLLLKEYVNL